MANAKPIRIKTIKEFYRLRRLPPPEHPLISVVDYSKMEDLPDESPAGVLFDFCKTRFDRKDEIRATGI